jgi:hypothetical protein
MRSGREANSERQRQNKQGRNTPTGSGQAPNTEAGAQRTRRKKLTELGITGEEKKRARALFLRQGKRALQNELNAGPQQRIWDTAGKKNAPTGSGHRFIQLLVYQDIKFCQGKVFIFL